jgi:hypothetical protein
MNKFPAIKLVLFLCTIITGKFTNGQQRSAELLISFQHTANGKPLVLKDSSFTNAFGEQYQVTRLKYYISNIRLDGDHNPAQNHNVFLIDAASSAAILLKVAEGSYNTLHFTLGVDSIFNCSGAQDGALDPLNGMFWTWNTGYIFFKLEGYSPASTADLNRIEHHIGGYQGPYRAQRTVSLKLEKPLLVKENVSQQVNLQLDLDKYWQAVRPVKIAEHSLVMSPGALASSAADNFSSMFSLLPIP